MPSLPRDARAAAARSYARRARDLLRDAARPGGDPTAPHHLIWFLINCPVAEFRDPTEAIRMVQNLLERAPNSWVAWANLGAAQYRAGNASRRDRSLRHGPPRSIAERSSTTASSWRWLTIGSITRTRPEPASIAPTVGCKIPLERGRPATPHRGRRAPRADQPRHANSRGVAENTSIRSLIV